VRSPEKGLTHQASVLRVIADHAAAEQELVPQGRVAEEASGATT
jgi:hypothetical protein